MVNVSFRGCFALQAIASPEISAVTPYQNGHAHASRGCALIHRFETYIGIEGAALGWLVRSNTGHYRAA
jgi:hypothetical protein